MTDHHMHSRRGIFFALGLLVALLVGSSAVSAQQLVQADKRLNQIANFGGDALYCIDGNQSPTTDTKSWDHFRLLSGSGQ